MRAQGTAPTILSSMNRCIMASSGFWRIPIGTCACLTRLDGSICGRRWWEWWNISRKQEFTTWRGSRTSECTRMAQSRSTSLPTSSLTHNTIPVFTVPSWLSLSGGTPALNSKRTRIKKYCNFSLRGYPTTVTSSSKTPA